MRRLFRVVLVFVLSAISAPVLMAGVVLAAFLFLPLPATLPTARVTEVSQISRIFAANGEEIGVFREFEQNIPVKQQDIPAHLKHAVISAEDQSFYSHGGVDVRGSLRALVADLRGGGLVQGGSTITQQYVKNAYVGRERSLARKVREAVVASQLDRSVDKEEILFRYLSSIYLGEGAYGVGAASETYFRKGVADLTISEAATLAGVIPAPSRYSPRANPEGAELKRKIVLRKMLEQGYITEAQHAEALAQPVWLAVQGPPPGPATVIHPPQRQDTRFPYFVDYLQRYLVDMYGPEKVFRGGLKIQTTLDLEMQAAAERAVNDALKGTSDPIAMSLVSVEPPTGYVKAMVGGRDFGVSQVNLALGKCPDRPSPDREVVVEASCWGGEEVVVEGGGTGRQPGSSWKPFVLAAAFEKGIQPSKVYPAPNSYRVPGCVGDKCTLGNYEGSSYGSADLRKATAASINTVYAQLIRDVGIKETAEMARKLGVTSAWYAPGVQGISYALGAQEVSPLDMAAAYGVFAARGMRASATPVFKIEEPDGTVLEDNSEREPVRVLDEVIADNVTDVMRSVITSGTGKSADIGRPAAGKTGTTNDYKDAWFVGYTPSLSTAVWMGNRQTPTPLRNIKGRRSIAGGTIPAPTWGAFMKDALKDVPVTEFNEPAPIKVIADELKRQARRGIDPGGKRAPAGTGVGGPYEYGPPKPKAVPPTTTTTVDSGTGGGGGGGRTTTTTTPNRPTIPGPGPFPDPGDDTDRTSP